MSECHHGITKTNIYLYLIRFLLVSVYYGNVTIISIYLRTVRYCCC